MSPSFYQRLFDLKSFQTQYAALARSSVRQALSAFNTDTLADDLDLSNLITIASGLALSSDPAHLSASFRIAHYTLSQGERVPKEYLNAAAFLLERLGSYPSIKLSLAKGAIGQDYRSTLPLAAYFSTVKNRVNRVVELGSQKYYLSDFQKEVFEAVANNDRISVSAPTSTGKSYVVKLVLLDQLLSDEQTMIMYIVPTRALIGQVERDVRKLSQEHGLYESIAISTMPRVDKDPALKQVFIFTQERAHWYLSENHGVRFQLVLVDEAQSTAASYRGILLQQVVESIAFDHKTDKLIFLTPGFRNPEALLKISSRNGATKIALSTRTQGTNQNILLARQLPRKPTHYALTLIPNIDLGTFSLPALPRPASKKLPLIAFALEGKGASSIIYADGPALAEKQAVLLHDLMGTDLEDQRLADLIDLVKQVIHPKYILATVLERGVAFHYGNLPLVIREEIEHLFQLGVIRYLVTTSTLVEGVNLPARSVYLRNPKRGNSNPFKREDFLNMAGRAGRLGREFQGNIICVDPESWKNKTFESTEQPEIEFASEKLIDDPKPYFSYIKNLPSVAQPRFEAGYNYHYVQISKGRIRSVPSQLQNLIRGSRITISNSIVARNPGIAPPRLESLLAFLTSLHASDLPNYIPENPSSDYAAQSYARILGLCNKHLGSSYSPRIINYLSILVTNWMRGYPIARIINENWRFWEPKKTRSLARVIRDTLNDVETFCRYEFLKYYRAYADVLREAMSSQGMEDVAIDIPQLDEWLEFGVASQTELSLIQLGLSRTVATMIFEQIATDDFSVSQARNWLKTNIRHLQISPILVREIRSILNLQENESGKA